MTRDRHDDEWLRLPGLFRRFEFEQVIAPAAGGERGEDWHVDEAGKDDHGVSLYVVYHRPHRGDEVPR